MSEEKNLDPIKREDIKDKFLLFIKRWWIHMVIGLAIGILFGYVNGWISAIVL
ncbi:MAG: hypothetical protein ACFFCS_11170 [Candidatus Hodarchaeota archaeon]